MNDRMNILRELFQNFPIIIKYLEDTDFVNQPASAKYHGNYDGGLFDHSVNVMMQLEELTNKLELKWQRDTIEPCGLHTSCILIGMLHDICKVDCYVKTGNTYSYRSNVDWSHGKKSAKIVKEICKDINDEELACIKNHMGAFGDKDVESEYSAAVRQFQNVLWTHVADMYSSSIIEAEVNNNEV